MLKWKTASALEIVRGLRLFLNVEAGITGVGAVARRFGPHPARTCQTRQPSNGATSPPAVATSENGGASVAKHPAPQNAGISIREQRLASTNRKLKRELAQARDAARRQASETRDTPVFFVVGMGKSGTSWLMNTLNGHPEILCNGEGRFFGREWRRENHEKINKPVLASSFYSAMSSSEYLRLWVERSVWTRNGDPEELLAGLMHAAIDHILLKALAESGKKVVGDKSLLTPGFVEEVRAIYPEAKIVHIIRDGRDAAVSQIHHMWNRDIKQGGVHDLKPEEIEKRETYLKDPKAFLESGESIFTEKRLRWVAKNWNLRIGEAIHDGPTLFGANYIEVRYEDLLDRPHEEVRQLAAFLGVDTRDEAVEQAVGAASFEKMSRGRQRGEEDPTSFFRKGIAGDWKNYFTTRDKEIYKGEAGALLVKLGYETDQDW